MSVEKNISWLLEGDVSIQYQTRRDLLGTNKPHLRKKIESEGWGARFLHERNKKGHWGKGFYQPKWTSTHYTLLDLRNLNVSPACKPIRETLAHIFNTEKATDGGIYPIGSRQTCDVCVNGMALNYSSYFGVKEAELKSVIDFLLSEKMSDGGFNCQSNRSGAVHSSLHSTISVIEGMLEYERNGYRHRLEEVKLARNSSEEFIMMHRLFKSDKTGIVINPEFINLHYPARWKYDILRALDYFQSARKPYDVRMDDALAILRQRMSKDGTWKLAAHYPGQRHFDMEEAGAASRWNTLRALRVLRRYARRNQINPT